ncbi:MAG: hypothetical protein OEZ11_10920 [Gammaproteobacteria bacterium]|nr:hypothetical protein [Gammaproteobacteria bacterium]
MSATRILPWYYAATVVFLLLDYLGGVNVRVAFLESLPAARLAYYAICFTCLALMIWRPAWTTLIGTFESLVTLIALIFSMALRVLIPTDAIFEENAAFVTYQEIVNFMISGSVAYVAWTRGLQALRGQ